MNRIETTPAERRSAILDRLEMIAEKAHRTSILTKDMAIERAALKSEMAKIVVTRKETELTDSQIWG